jgi:4-amino-4-deoxy-L-arabinose transferase-like glycosyltransferase
LPAFILKNQRDIIKLGIILLVALIIRLLAIPYIPSEVNIDNSTYQIAASDLIRDGIITNPYIMPLYPLFLAVLGGGEKAQILTGVIFGLISVVLVWAFALALFDDKKAGLVAAGMMAIYPMAISTV